MAKGITRSGIVAAALHVLDAQGIEGVTVRAVAARLEVKAPALYWHVRGKQELLDEMGTEIQRRVLARLAATPAEPQPVAELARYARVLRREYLAHRDGARTFSGTRLTDPAVLRAQEPTLARWLADGVEVAAAVAAVQLATAFVVGFVIEEQERAQSGEARYSLAERDAAVGPDAPLVAAAGRLLAADPEARFEAQLGILLAGVAATLGPSSAPSPEPGAAF